MHEMNDDVSERTMDITELPDELYQFLFEFLNLSDVINLQFVCRFFNAKVKAYKVRDLFFQSSLCSTDWHFPLPNYTFRNILHPSKAFLLKRSLFKIEHLKYFKFKTFGDFDKFGIDYKEIVNKLVYLVHLEISFKIPLFDRRADQIRDSQDGKLILPRLEKLHFEDNPCSALEIDAPNLRDFHFDVPETYGANEAFERKWRTIKFTHPSSVKWLWVYKFGFLQQRFSALQKVKHLTILNGSDLDTDYLLDYYSDLETVSMRICSLYGLERLIQRKSLLKAHVKVYFEGIEISDHKELAALEEEINRRNLNPKSIHYFLSRASDTMLRNYEKLSQNLFWVRELDYKALMNLVAVKPGLVPEAIFNRFNYLKAISTESEPDERHYLGLLPEELAFDRFNYLRKISTESEFDERHFLKFLTCCQSLTQLYFYGSKISQTFLDELPSVTSLRFLKLIISSRNPPDLDFRFLNRMANLENFRTNLNIVRREGLNLNRHGRFHNVILMVSIDDVEGLILVTKNLNTNDFNLTISILNSLLNNKMVNTTFKELNYEQLKKWYDHWEDKAVEFNQLLERVKRGRKRATCLRNTFIGSILGLAALVPILVFLIYKVIEENSNKKIAKTLKIITLTSW